MDFIKSLAKKSRHRQMFGNDLKIDAIYKL